MPPKSFARKVGRPPKVGLPNTFRYVPITGGPARDLNPRNVYEDYVAFGLEPAKPSQVVVTDGVDVQQNVNADAASLVTCTLMVKQRKRKELSGSSVASGPESKKVPKSVAKGHRQRHAVQRCMVKRPYRAVLQGRLDVV